MSDNKAEFSFLQLERCIQKGLAPEEYNSLLKPTITNITQHSYNRRSIIARNIEKKWEEVWKSEKMNQNPFIFDVQIDRYHSCINDECHKQGFITLRGNKNVYQCMKSGKIHICNNDYMCEEFLTYEGNICYISGYKLDTPEKVDKIFESCVTFINPVPKAKPTFFTKKYAQPKFKVIKKKEPQNENKHSRITINVLSLFDEITNIVLYNVDKRRDVNKKKKQDIEKKWKHEFSKYIAECIENGSTPNSITLSTIHINITKKHPFMRALVKEEESYSSYRYICHNLWLIHLLLNSFKNNTKTQAMKFIFGFLYLMRDLDTSLGSESIYKNLPLQNEIHLFSDEYNVTTITQGNKIVKGLITDINSYDIDNKYVNELLSEIYQYIDDCKVDISNTKRLFE